MGSATWRSPFPFMRPNPAEVAGCSRARRGVQWRRGVDGRSLAMVHVLFLNTRSAIGADVAVHLELIRALDRRRCTVAVATNQQAVDADRMASLLAGAPETRVEWLDLGGGARTALGCLPRLARLVRRETIDVVHTTDRPRDSVLGVLLARMTRRRCVIHVHVGWSREMGRASNWALHRCDRVIAISSFVRQTLLGCGVPERKVHRIYNATDADRFDPAVHPRGSLRREFAIPAGVPLVGIAGRILVWKGHLELVDAMARVRERLPEARLLIVGREDANAGGAGFSEQVRARVRERGLEDAVVWTGWREEMGPVYADLDVLCVPSREEPFGLVVTEAMAMERPVVGFRAGALPEVVEHDRTGLLAPRGDTGALADALSELLADAGRRAAMGRAGRTRVLDLFTPRRQADEVLAHYERLLPHRPASEVTSALQGERNPR